MNLHLLFSIYLIGVAVAAVSVTSTFLGKREAQVAAVALLLWLGYAATLGASGLASRTGMPPGTALIAFPPVLLLVTAMLTRPGAALARLIPLRLLLGFQIFRFGVELTLHRLSTLGMAPRLMTLEGGNVEILVAATAPIAAWFAARGPVGRKVAWSWNVVGLLSLGNIVVRAVLSAPGPLELIHAETPDVAILTYPFTFIPGFMVPLALSLHILAFRSLHAARALNE